MDMKLSEEQSQLRDSARKFMEEACTGDFIRSIEEGDVGYSPEMWEQMAELGWLGIGLPDDCGGLEMSHVDMVVLAKELGRQICPSPFMTSVVLSAEAIARGGSPEQKQAVAEIVAGEKIISWTYQEQTLDFDPGAIKLQAREDGDDYVLDGTKMFVEFAANADLFLVTARTAGESPAREGVTLMLVDAKSAGIETTHLHTVARDHHYKVTFDAVRVPKTAVVGSAGDAWSILEPVLEKAAVVWSAYVVGVAEQMHEYATEYAKNRVQFSRPIGQMQTIQGYLAQLIIEIYGAETITFFTAFGLDKGRNMRDYVAKMKVFCGEAVKNTTDVGSQIFGGMGYMEEQDTTQYLRRGRHYKELLGGTGYWEKIVAEELLDSPVQSL
jgi:alkylation response protein AidB-like acyl-CoA dehydrogenase